MAFHVASQKNVNNMRVHVGWQKFPKKEHMSSSTEINMENYLESLSQNDKLAYTNHIRLESGKTLPYSLRNDWIKDVDASPEVSWEDVTHHLNLETPSIYIKEKLKAYKLLETYDHFVCGHVPKFIAILLKNYSTSVPSQRQSDSSNMCNVWVCIHKKHGWILTANCACMAG